MNGFLLSHFRKYGAEGYSLKCDIRKFFDSIDHEILKQRLACIFTEEAVLGLLYQIIDGFEVTPGRGLPMGNQTSQWFAIYYLDGLDRLVKEKLRIKGYSRYMDDCVLIHPNKDYLKYCLSEMTDYLQKERKLEFNAKTQIFPIRNGVDYLGWHLYLTDTGKVIRKVRRKTKTRYKRRLNQLQNAYAEGEVTLSEIHQILSSYYAYLSYGHTYQLRKKAHAEFVLHRIP